MPINIQKYEEIKKLLKTQEISCAFMIVTKNQSRGDILELLKRGHLLFGENRVLEGVKKYDDLLRDEFKNIELHLIGSLQSNKIKLALQNFDVIQSIDREKLIMEIEKNFNKGLDIRTKEFFIQVNIGNEQQKSGIQVSQLPDFYQFASKKIKINGLMCIPPNFGSPKKYFLEMLSLKNKLNPKLKLSMGMSNDFQDAVECQSNMIRIGSAIFQ